MKRADLDQPFFIAAVVTEVMNRLESPTSTELQLRELTSKIITLRAINWVQGCVAFKLYKERGTVAEILSFSSLF